MFVLVLISPHDGLYLECPRFKSSSMACLSEDVSPSRRGSPLSVTTGLEVLICGFFPRCGTSTRALMHLRLQSRGSNCESNILTWRVFLGAFAACGITGPMQNSNLRYFEGFSLLFLCARYHGAYAKLCLDIQLSNRHIYRGSDTIFIRIIHDNT